VIARQLAAVCGGLTVEQLTADHIAMTADSWRPLKQNTRRAHLGWLKMLVRHMKPSLLSAVPHRPPTQLRTVIATPEELTRLLTQTPVWLQCFVLLCGQLGLRFSEAARACPADWHQDTSTLDVIAKGGQHRILPVTPELKTFFSLAARRGEDAKTPFIYILYAEPARTGPHKGSLLRNSQVFIRNRWRRWKKKLNINPALTIHDLRRTRITEVYRQTLDVKLAQQFAGHKNIASTAFYLSPWDDTHVLEAIRNSAPPRGWTPRRTP
jgi:integrase